MTGLLCHLMLNKENTYVRYFCKENEWHTLRTSKLLSVQNLGEKIMQFIVHIEQTELKSFSTLEEKFCQY